MFERSLKMKVAVYCRISKDNLGQDIDRQIHEVREYCKRMDYEVVEEYLDEGFARTTRNRPSLDKLIKDARQKKFKLVVSDELSRFAGTPKLLLDLLEELKVWNVNICSVKEGIDTSSVMGELVATMLSAISKMELFNLSHRVKSGIANAKRKNGDVWGRRTNLTDEISKQILENRKLGWGIKKLANEFSVSHQTIRKVIV
jgi:site-specific DNA recombinase|tara:strand:+ start:273 stop:875 length:603 start_codon:yes stop_codon:yes gene_type:complete